MEWPPESLLVIELVSLVNILETGRKTHRLLNLYKMIQNHTPQYVCSIVPPPNSY